MLILTLRTDKPEAELGLCKHDQAVAALAWQAHRALAETIHSKIKETLTQANYQLTDLDGMIVFRGPGSFTGLRIGISVANALADGLQLPIVGAVGGDWIADGMRRLKKGENDRLVLPEYGAPPHITAPKH